MQVFIDTNEKRQYRGAQKKRGEFLKEHGFYIIKDEERLL